MSGYTKALFNGENQLLDLGKDIGQRFTKSVYGMSQRKAQRLIKEAGAQVESQLIGSGEAAKFKKMILMTLGEGVATISGGEVLGLGKLAQGFLSAAEGGYNVHRLSEGDDPPAEIAAGTYVIINNGSVPVVTTAGGGDVRAPMHIDPSFRPDHNDFAVHGQKPFVEMGEGVKLKDDISYGFFIQSTDALNCKVYNFELNRPEDKLRKHVVVCDEAKQAWFLKQPIDAIRKSYFQAEKSLIINGRLSVDPGTEVFEKSDPRREMPYTVIQADRGKALLEPEGWTGNRKWLAIEKLVPGRQEHTTQFSYGDSFVNVDGPAGKVPIHTGQYMWFKNRTGLADKFGGKLQSQVEMAILRDIDASTFQVVFAYDGTVTQYNSDDFYSNVLPFSDGDRAMILKHKAFQVFKAKVMDEDLRNWQGYVPGSISAEIATVTLGHLEVNKSWSENLRTRERLWLDRKRRIEFVKKSVTIVGKRVPATTKAQELDSAETLATLGITASKAVDVMYGEMEVDEEPVPESNPTNNMLAIGAAVIIGGYIMSNS